MNPPSAFFSAIVERDLKPIAELETRIYSHPWSLGNFADALTNGYWMEKLCAEQNQIIGYFVAMRVVDEAHLLNISVLPEKQHQGVGSQLFAQVAKTARALNLSSILLEVRASNQQARAFYAKQGFVGIGVRKGYYAHETGREDAQVLRLNL